MHLPTRFKSHHNDVRDTKDRVHDDRFPPALTGWNMPADEACRQSDLLS